jgi:single-strand DNA-binding protein
MEPQIMMQGNLVADPVRRATASGVAVTKFRLASSGRRFDRARNEWVSTDPVYMSVSCWRQLGDNVAQTLRKGDTVVVHGKLTFREYDDSHGGPRRQAYEIDASSVAPDLARYVATLSRPLRDLEPPHVGADEPAGTPTGTAERDGLPAQPTNPWNETRPDPVETAA